MTTQIPSALWQKFTLQELSQTPICDLELDWRQSPQAPLIKGVIAKLHKRGIFWTPEIYFSTEWFCADGEPAVAIPYYLAHPKLLLIARKKGRYIEGHTTASFKKLFSHELGHAFEHAYRTTHQAWRRDLFGSTSKPYPQRYDYLKYSKNYVKNLPYGYAQSHPDEDFAETFSVWLQPKSEWRRKYSRWPALKKLLGLDEQIKFMRGQGPLKQKCRFVDGLSSCRLTVGQLTSRLHCRRVPVSTQPIRKDIARLSRHFDLPAYKIQQCLQQTLGQAQQRRLLIKKLSYAHLIHQIESAIEKKGYQITM